jgi:hypothetical protein
MSPGITPAGRPAYNDLMQHCHSHRTLLLAALVVFGVAPASAQTSAVPPAVLAAPASLTADKPASRPDRTIERIRTEDAGSRIDELRVGGETQSITVQPAANVPAYEVRPMGAARGASGAAADNASAGSRFWNILKF